MLYCYEKDVLVGEIVENLFGLAMDIGEKMLISGAEVHRVEEAIKKMCLSFGATRVDVFIITSSMVATVFDDTGKTYTQTRRITTQATDFEKLHHLNNLARKICNTKMSENEIVEKLAKCENRKVYPLWLEIVCYAVIAGAFTLFFGGKGIEMVVSLVIGAIVRLGIWLTEKAIPNKIFTKFISAVIATFFAFLAINLGVIGSVDKVIIGNIMTLIPGIGLTNALRDLFTGDSIAGLLRSIEAVLIALAIAAGYFLVAVLGGFVL